MPKGKKQKLKLYYLSKILLEKTDATHMLTLPEIKDELSKYGVSADRKSLYDDIQTLKILGIEVTGKKIQHYYYYHVTNKQFKFSDLKLLIETIQTSSHISARKSSNLVKKLTSLASNYEASQLNRPIIVPDRTNSTKKSIYSFTSHVHCAMTANKQIRFAYIERKPSDPTHSPISTTYTVSPWAVVYANDDYYVVAYDEDADQMRQFQFRLMKTVRIRPNKRMGKELYQKTCLCRLFDPTFSTY